MKVNGKYLDSPMVISNGTYRRRVNDNVNSWIPALALNTAGSGSALTTPIDTLMAWPWAVESKIRISALGSISTNNPASNNFRWAIYKDDGNFYPTTMIPGTDTGAFNGAAGFKSGNFNSTLTLDPGYYFLVLCSATATLTLRRMTAQALGAYLGASVVGGVLVNNLNWRASFTFAALPEVFPTGATLAQDVAPYIMLKPEV